MEALQDIEREGGLLAAMQNGYLADLFGSSERQRNAEHRTRARVVVGINRYADPELGGPVSDESDLDDRDDSIEQLLAAAAVRRAQRTEKAVDDALATLRNAPRDGIVDAAVDAAGAGATVAEIAQATWPPEGTGFRHRCVLVAGTDAWDFELARSAIESVVDDVESAPCVRIVSIGPVRATGPLVDFARDLLQVGGFPVADLGRFDAPDAATTAVRDAEPTALILCCDPSEVARALDGLGATLADLEPPPCVIVPGAEPETPDPRVSLYLDPAADAIDLIEQLAGNVLGLYFR